MEMTFSLSVNMHSVRGYGAVNVKFCSVNPRAWIVLGWLFLFAAIMLALTGAVQVANAASPVVCAVPAGVSCSPGGAQLLPGISVAISPGSAIIGGVMFAVAGGVAFFSALACFFWAAHLRTLAALHTLADVTAHTRKAQAVAKIQARLPSGKPGGETPAT